MSDISKRYVKALIKTVKKNKLAEVASTLSSIVPAYKDLKFKTILYANDIPKEKKVEFLVSLVDKCDDSLKNLFKILAEYGRLNLLPNISKELNFEVAKILNKHHGLVITNKKLSKDKIKKIEKNLSKKFNTTIELEPKKSDYNGIKVEVETLGVEIAFSADRLKSQLLEHILKSI